MKHLLVIIYFTTSMNQVNVTTSTAIIKELPTKKICEDVADYIVSDLQKASSRNETIYISVSSKTCLPAE